MRGLLAASILICAAIHSPADPTVSESRRLYDFTPVSATNPVIARVENCGIEIPVSEFQAYARTILPSDIGASGAPLTGAGKRRLLDDLIDDHLLLWDGYQKKADQTSEMIRLLKTTESMLLQETIVQQEIGNKAKTPEEFQRLSQKLRDEVFEKTEIAVSNESYDQLKATIHGQGLASAPTVDLATLPAAVRDRPLAHWKGGTVTIGDVLSAWAQEPLNRRPNLDDRDALTSLLKTMLEDALLAEAARDRGLQNAPMVLQKMQENRNVLTRMYAIDRITGQAVARMKEPGTSDRVRAWFETNRTTRYTYRDEQGKPREVSFEAERESIENDYFDALNEQIRAEYVRGLRKGRPVEINERLLEQLTVVPASAESAELSSSVLAWDSEIREHTVCDGETNAVFTFQFTNTSPAEVTLFEIKPSCDCTTIQSAPLPWKLAPGGSGKIQATVDLRNKTNSYTRTIEVESSRGSKTLTLKIVMPRTVSAGNRS